MHSAMHGHFTSWSLTLALAAIAAVYLFFWRPLDGSRAACFLGGVAVVWIAIASPLAMLDHELLTIHMLQHLLLMAVGAPLILLGLPARRPVQSLKRSALCWLAGTATLIGWHLPAAFQLALESPWWHGAEQATFLLAGLLFWWPVVQSLPSCGLAWSVPLYLFAATLPCDILSAFLTFCGRVVYPHYLASARLFDWSPLEDQEFAGALMWVSVTVIYLIPAIIVTMQILSPNPLNPLSRQPATARNLPADGRRY
jgi:cytochrome c oxidase assembly factor CtaG